MISWPFSTRVRKWTSLEEALRKREIDCEAYCSNFGFRSLCLSGVLVAVIIKICCDLRPTNSFCCFLFQPFPTARIVPHLTEPLAHFSHSHSTSLRSRPHSFSLLQNYDFLVHAHLVLDFFVCLFLVSKIITPIFTIRALTSILFNKVSVTQF